MMDMYPVPEGSLLREFDDTRMDLMVNEMQFLRFRNSKNFASEFTLKRANLRDDSAFGKPFEKDASIWNDAAVSKVIGPELLSRFHQALFRE